MRDIREIVQSALDSAFYGKVDVTPEELISDELPDEYITYAVVSGGYTHYVNNRPIRKMEYVDVTRIPGCSTGPSCGRPMMRIGCTPGSARITTQRSMPM